MSGGTRLSAPAPAARAWLDGVNPVTKVAMVLVLAVPLLVSLDAVSAGVAIALELLCVPLTGVAAATVLKRLVPVLVFAPVAGLSMLLYARPGGTVYGTFLFATVSDDSLALSLAVMLRVVALALPLILLFARTDPTELADALAQVAK
ncbi:CbiQ family ECF transporter T component, partial [Microbacterium sp. HMWF026]|uniref:CbiQ family ECF transporter T component n=1 Tax=Microbacterium sp. HMWF026 TaxID=2056861 RepID=UPI0035BF4CFC